jgi:hypothetical protein
MSEKVEFGSSMTAENRFQCLLGAVGRFNVRACAPILLHDDTARDFNLAFTF